MPKTLVRKRHSRSPAPEVPQPSTWKPALAVTAVFMAVAIYNVSAHVLWRDEIRFWQFAVASPTFAAMRANMQFEGAPWLWYGALWLLARITANPMAMQLFHVLIASGTVFLFAWRAPFSRTAKLLFPLGYFTLFEYATIARSYAVALLLVVAAAAILSLPSRRPVLFGVVLFLLTQTNIWGVGIAGVLYLSAVLEWTVLKPSALRLSWTNVILLGGVVLVGSVLCYVSSLPGPGPSFVHHWPDDETLDRKIARTIGAIWNGWVPLPRPIRHYWNSNILDDYLELRCTGACVLFGMAVLLFLRRPAALVPLVLGTAGLMGFTFFRFVGSVRHDGLYYVLLIAAFWIGATATRVPLPWPRASRIGRIIRAIESRGAALLVGLLAIQAVAGVGATIADHRLPFSGGKEIAAYVHRELPADVILVGYDDYSAATLGYFAKRHIHSVQADTQSEFFTQNDRVRTKGTTELLVARLETLLKRETRDVVVVLSPHREEEVVVWYDDNPHLTLSWEFLDWFENSTVKDEGSSLYRVRLTDFGPN